MNPLISVIVTTYNSAQSIERILYSVLNQTYKHFEVLIFDDASSDKTKELVHRILEHEKIRFKFFVSIVNNGGPAKGRNWGIANSSGKYLCFCDADDEWMEGKLMAQVQFMENNDFDFSGTSCLVIGAKQFPLFSGIVTVYSELRRNKFALSSLMIRKKCFTDSFIFDERKEYQSVEDFDLILRLYSKGFKGFVISKQLIKYYYDSTSLSHLSLRKSELRRILVLKNFYHKDPFTRIYSKYIMILLTIRIKANAVRNYFRQL